MLYLPYFPLFFMSSPDSAHGGRRRRPPSDEDPVPRSDTGREGVKEVGSQREFEHQPRQLGGQQESGQATGVQP